MTIETLTDHSADAALLAGLLDAVDLLRDDHSEVGANAVAAVQAVARDQAHKLADALGQIDDDLDRSMMNARRAAA